MAYSNSPLIDCKVLSPNHSGERTDNIDRISPHCVVGQLKAESIGNCFPKGRGASCNYGIGTEGRVCLIVEEKNRSWCTSSNSNDQRAITIECASDTKPPYKMNNKVYQKLIDLCEDICRRNGKTVLLWFANKEKSLSYKPKKNEMVLTVHRWFANKSCPGDWLYSRLGAVAKEVTARLNSAENVDKPEKDEPEKSTPKKLHKVQVGSFSKLSNAEKHLNKVKKAGFEAIMVKSGGLYKIQVGAYSKEENAKKMLEKIEDAGFEAIITTSSGTVVTNKKKVTEEVARKVIRGDYGNGEARKKKLEAEGYDFDEVQALVNKLL